MADATRRLMLLCSREEKCRADCFDKLNHWGISGKEAEYIIQYLEKERFIDDKRFSGIFARDKFRFNQWGRIRIRYMLHQKGISDDIISEALRSIDPDEYLTMIRKLLAEKARKINGKNEWEIRSKLLRYLQSKGFEYELALSVLKEES
jgi:regulatory protein